MPSSCRSISQSSHCSCITVSNVVSLISQSTTYLQTLHHLSVSISYLSSPTLNFTVTLSDIIIRRSHVESFFMGFSWSSSPRWCLLRLSPYDCVSPCHFTGGFVLTSLPDSSSTSSISFPGLVVSSTLSTSSSSDSTITLHGHLCLFAFALGVGSSNSDPSGSLSSSLLSLACLLQLFCFLGFGGKWDLGGIPFAMVRVTVGMVVQVNFFQGMSYGHVGPHWVIGCLLWLFFVTGHTK